MKRSRVVIPGGVNSPVRAFGSVGGAARFIKQAKGARIEDEDGNRYIDYVASWGPIIVGHAHPVVVEAVHRATSRGTSFGAPTEAEVLLAERVTELVPSVEMLRLVNSGTEAVMSALRLARGATGRDKLVKFEGCYHGHPDAMLAAAGSGVASLGIPGTDGVPAAAVADTLVVPYNDLDAVKAVFGERSEEIAAIIVEPVAANMGMVRPQPGFLTGLRELCDTHGSVLIFDEVITGFRLAAGGAQERFGVQPDLTTLGKVLGGGLPLGALAGRRDIMESLAPLGPVYQAGTLSGNPLATAAGIATLDTLREGGTAFYDELESRGERLESGLRRSVEEAGVVARLQRVGSMMTLFFNAVAAENMDSLKDVRTDLYARFFQGMLKRGVCFPPSQYEAFFVSAAHADADIDFVVNAAAEALKELE